MTCQPQHTYGPGADDRIPQWYDDPQDEPYYTKQAEQLYHPSAREHTPIESLAIAAEDFIADVDELLIAISGEGWLSRQIDGAMGSMTRLQNAIEAARGANDGS